MHLGRICSVRGKSSCCIFFLEERKKRKEGDSSHCANPVPNEWIWLLNPGISGQSHYPAITAARDWHLSRFISATSPVVSAFSLSPLSSDPPGVRREAGPRRDFREAHDTDAPSPWKSHQPAVCWTMTHSPVLLRELKRESVRSRERWRAGFSQEPWACCTQRITSERTFNSPHSKGQSPPYLSPGVRRLSCGEEQMTEGWAAAAHLWGSPQRAV